MSFRAHREKSFSSLEDAILKLNHLLSLSSNFRHRLIEIALIDVLRRFGQGLFKNPLLGNYNSLITVRTPSTFTSALRSQMRLFQL